MKKFLKSLVAVMLVCLMAVSFTSCAAKPSKVGEKLEEAGYTVVVLEGDEASKEADGAEGVTAMVTATKAIVNYVSVVWFANEDDAKKTAEDAQKGLDAMGDLAAGMKVVRKGKIVISGTATAVEDAKKAL